MKAKVRKLAIFLVKLIIGLGIIAYLFRQQWGELKDKAASLGEVHYGLLGGAMVLLMGCVLLSFVRWYLLVRSQDLPLRLRDTFRLSFIGYFFNTFIPGTIGGDLVKAVYVAREQSRRAVGVATVVLDRILGLYGMFCMAFLATVLFHERALSPPMRLVTFAIWGAFALGGIGLAATFAAVWARFRWLRRMTHWPVVGHTLEEVFKAIEVYRGRMRVLWVALAMSIGIHTLLTASIYVIMHSLPWDPASVGECYFIVPIGLFIASVPVTPGGLGLLEGTWGGLFGMVGYPHGLVVSLLYRCIMVLTTLPGFIYYLRGRPQIRQIMDQIEHEQTPDPKPA